MIGKLTMERFGRPLVLLLLFSSACASIGPKKLVSSHKGYNDAVQLAVAREVLTNIVRARYADPLRFLTVSSINAQFSVNVGGSADVGGGTGGVGGGLAGSVGYSDSPTITFVPHSDAAFYKSFYSPLDILETVGIGFTYKTEGDDYIRLLIGAINGASDRENGDLYERRIDAIGRLRQLGAFLQLKSDWARANDAAIPKAQMGAEGYAMALQEGYFWLETEDGTGLRAVRRRMVPALVIGKPDDPAVIAALTELGVKPGRQKYPFRPPSHARPGREDPFSIWVSPRSVNDVVRLAALQVDVPKSHQSIVPPPERFRVGGSFNLPLEIRHSASEPTVPYRVQHRGYWFYVDDTDVESRLFLDLIVTLYSSRVGSREARDSEPELVLPIGG